MLKKLKIFGEVFLIILFLIFEEFIWKQIVIPAKQWLKKKKIFKKAEKLIKPLNKYIILGLFLVPFVIGEGLGAISGILLISGHIISAVMVYIIKIGVATLSFWIYAIGKDKLLDIYFFKTSLDKILYFYNKLKNSDIYIKVKNEILVLKKMGHKNELKELYEELKEVVLNHYKDKKNSINQPTEQID